MRETQRPSINRPNERIAAVYRKIRTAERGFTLSFGMRRDSFVHL